MAIIDGQTPAPSPPPPAPGVRPTVVVRLSAGATPAAAPELANRLAGRTVRPYFASPAGVAEDGPPDPPPVGLEDYLAVEAADANDAEALAASLREDGDVETAYVECGPQPPPGPPVGANPLAGNQGYLEAAPRGIDARWTWAHGTGQPVGFVDVEQGWSLDHEDLQAAHIGLISGLNLAYPGHGTAVLGEVAAVDNGLGVVGIAFGGNARVISQHRADGYRTALAISDAAQTMAAGDVMLLEAQAIYATSGNAYVPVEVEDAVYGAIVAAVQRGIIVVEAGGNGSLDLDTFQDVNGRFVLNRGHADFRDSGAILVGAASAAAPHQRLDFSNFGSRIDCYAWGERIQTCGDGWTGNAPDLYTASFGGTSGASPIVAGAALLVQSWRQGHGGRLSPAQMRRLLCDPNRNTRSANPAVDRIGVMPNLRAIIQALSHQPHFAQPPAAVPA